jgi:hypothetical protein
MQLLTTKDRQAGTNPSPQLKENLPLHPSPEHLAHIHETTPVQFISFTTQTQPTLQDKRSGDNTCPKLLYPAPGEDPWHRTVDSDVMDAAILMFL